MSIHILSLETSSSLCGVALLSSGEGQPVLRVREHDATAEHAERLLPMAESLLQEAGIERTKLQAVAFGQGPGGFTGLRVACGVAQGVGFALGIPVIEIPSLLAVAVRDASDEAAGLRVVVQDARMGEVYLAAYRQTAPAWEGALCGQWDTVQSPLLLNADDVAIWLDTAVLPHGQACRLTGDALQAYPALAALDQTRPWLQIGLPLRADAATVAWLAWDDWRAGWLVRPDHAAPLYVRDKVAFTTIEREQGAGGNPRAGAAPAMADAVGGAPADGASQASSVLRTAGATQTVGASQLVDAQPLAEAPLFLDAMRTAHLDDVTDIEGSVQSHPWTRGNFADGLNAGYCSWVACRADQVVGFSMLMLAPDVAHLLVIAVRRGEQQRGAGALLLRRCESEAAARGLPAVMLEVRPSNETALRFYQARGYRVVGRRREYYPTGHGRREDALVMEKRLDGADAPAVERGTP